VQALPDVVERERGFYNVRDGSYRRWRNVIWRAIGPFNRNDEVHQLYDPRGKRVLLYGCGAGYDSRRLAEEGAASIVGIDISEAQIAEARLQADAGGYAGPVEFRVADAHHTGFPDNAFDLVVGIAILHHLDLPRALSEIRRILAPSGRGVFLEPLAQNPLLRLARRLTPAARTPDEHPLTTNDWRMCGEVFSRFRHREMELTSIPLMPLVWVLPRAWHQPLARRVSAFDDRVLERHPGLRPFARTTLLILE
jgi:ubiquinone/menaquinone biosynthesis C-methylase UbiE